jgi:replication factor C small subunit
MSFIESNVAEVPQPKVVNSLWAEKYRPERIEDYIGNDMLKAKVLQYISENDIPHLLLYGGAGTGKTSLAKLIVKTINCDYMYLNASDERGIDTVRGKIRSFAASMGFHDLKIVILDESDALTPDGQRALRNLMETYSMTTRFILTCNYQERIIDPIVSRSQPFQITPPNKKDVAALLVRILTAEGIKFDKEGVVAIVQSHYPDIRAVINTAQRSVVSDVLTLDKQSVLDGDVKSKVIEVLKTTDRKQAFRDIRQLLADNSIRDFAAFYTLLYEKVDEFAPNNISQVILELADGQYKDASVVDKEINFCATLIRVLNVMK